MMQITGCELEELRIGMPVKVEFRKMQVDGEAEILMYGYKEVPV